MKRKTTFSLVIAILLLVGFSTIAMAGNGINLAPQAGDEPMSTSTPMPMPMQNSAAGMNAMGSTTAGACPMMSGMTGMSGATGMSGMSGTTGMSGMTNMGSMTGSGMAMNGMGMQGMDSNAMFVNNNLIWYRNPWVLLGWVVLGLVILAALLGLVLGTLWIIRRSRRIPPDAA